MLNDLKDKISKVQNEEAKEELVRMSGFVEEIFKIKKGANKQIASDQLKLSNDLMKCEQVSSYLQGVMTAKTKFGCKDESEIKGKIGKNFKDMME